LKPEWWGAALFKGRSTRGKETCDKRCYDGDDDDK